MDIDTKERELLELGRPDDFDLSGDLDFDEGDKAPSLGALFRAPVESKRHVVRNGRRASPDISVAEDAEPTSPSLQSRQMTYEELASELFPSLPDASKEAIDAQIEAEVLAQRIRCITVYESPVSDKKVVRFLRQATTLPLFQENPSMSNPSTASVAPVNMDDIAQKASELARLVSQLSNPLDAGNVLRDALGASGHFKMIKKMESHDVYGGATPENGKRLPRMLVLDVETTGLDYRKHKVIELGMVLIEFSPTKGEFGRVLERYNGMEDPGEPISEEVTKVTGITDEMVKGQKLDEERIGKIVAMADLVVSHNATFDRPFTEKRIPELAKKWWGCSMAQGPWKEMAIGSSKLEYLCYKVGGFFYEAHRAMTDVEATIKLMSTQGEGRTVLAHLLEKVRQPTYTIWATNSPFETKDKLKESGYRWSGEENKATGELKAWYKEGLSEEEKNAEIEFLSELYKGSCVIDRLNGATRYAKWIDPQYREKVDLVKRKPSVSP